MEKRAQVERMARELMDKHGLSDWRLGFDNGIWRLGFCQRGAKLISLSKHFVELNTLERIQMTIFHEIAHALTPGEGHSDVWARKCIEIGGTGKRFSNDAKLIPHRYEGTCRGCGAVYKRMKLPRIQSCGVCDSEKFNPEYVIQYQRVS